MTPLHKYLLRYGMAGLPAGASSQAQRWERRLNWPLFATLCLAIPAGVMLALRRCLSLPTGKPD
jgi:hypothetical protein